MQLLVLGMHRSGTSTVTRLLNLAGAYFGTDDDATETNQENPKGFWERRDIRRGHPGITYLEAGDVDGDGRVDLISSTYEFGTRDRISWWRNLGN